MFGLGTTTQKVESAPQREVPNVITLKAEQKGGDDEDEDLDYESDENEDNIVSEEEINKIRAIEESKLIQNVEELKNDQPVVEDDATAYKTKVIKDEQVEKLLSDVSEKYQPLFLGTTEPKINKQILEQDLDDLDSHPWRKPNANQEDYFNYGFDEETWSMYCKRQKDIRGQASMSKPINVFTGFVSSERTKKIEDRDKDLLRQMAKSQYNDEDTEEAGLNNIPEEVVHLSEFDKKTIDSENTRELRDLRDSKDLRDSRESRDIRDTRDFRESREIRDTRDHYEQRDWDSRERSRDHRYEFSRPPSERDYSRERSSRDYPSRDGGRREEPRKREREYSTHDYERDSKRQRR